MNSKELINNILRGKKCPRMGVVDFPWTETLNRWVAEGYPVDEKGNPVSPIDHFNFDMDVGGIGFDTMPLAGYEEIVEENDEWISKRNGAGATKKHWKNKTSTPEHIDFRMTSRKIWEEDYRPHMLEVDRSRFDFNAIRKARESSKWVFCDDVFIWESFRQSVGDVCMLEGMLLDPEWIYDYNRVYTDFFKAHYKLLFAEVGKPDGLWISEDFGYKNGLFCSPQVLEELFFPFYKEIVDFVHSYDLPIVLHACGGIEKALPLIVNAGFDGLNPMQVSAGCDVVRFAEKYGDKLAFIGGLDARILESGDRKLIKGKIIEMLGALKSLGARYVFGSDHSISVNVSYADFKYALDVYRDNMTY